MNETSLNAESSKKDAERTHPIRIVGLRKAVHDLMTLPGGWCCGMWVKRIDTDAMEVWSCKYLTWNPQIEGYGKEGKRIEPTVIELHDSYGYSWTRAIRMAIEEVSEPMKPYNMNDKFVITGFQLVMLHELAGCDKQASEIVANVLEHKAEVKE